MPLYFDISEAADGYRVERTRVRAPGLIPRKRFDLYVVVRNKKKRIEQSLDIRTYVEGLNDLLPSYRWPLDAVISKIEGEPRFGIGLPTGHRESRNGASVHR
tara:strand:+ start:122 stop:427 length:306 start_codon:yes stop_codon:yes gene_type:complete